MYEKNKTVDIQFSANDLFLEWASSITLIVWVSLVRQSLKARKVLNKIAKIGYGYLFLKVYLLFLSCNSSYAMLNTKINALTLSDQLNIDLVHPGFNNTVLLEGTKRWLNDKYMVTVAPINRYSNYAMINATNKTLKSICKCTQ